MNEKRYQIDLYTKEHCPACRAVKKKLETENIQFGVINLSAMSDKVVKEFGISKLPLLEIVDVQGEYDIPLATYEGLNEIMEHITDIIACIETLNKEGFHG